MPGDPIVPPIIESTFTAYARSREQFYSQPEASLKHLLTKDVLLYAMRGAATADHFVDAAFPAFEAASEETVWGNTWQEAIAKIAPNTVGGGDLRTERDGELWIIQLKLGRQNANTVAQDVRILRNKVLSERDHHPGRKSVKAMYATIRGAPTDYWTYFQGSSGANEDIHGFGYQVKTGVAFLRWISAEFDQGALLRNLDGVIGTLPGARMECIHRLKLLLDERLEAAGLPHDMAGVIALSEMPPVARRKSRAKDQSSS